ncbi:MAG TPA: DUF3307 domain-containing protein [Candidatus Limnocylindrales bacterium]
MAAEPVLVLAWLVLAHLVADFVLQTDAIVADKVAAPRHRRWRGLMAHGGIVAGCLLPFAIAFGAAGVATLLTILSSHVIIDRWKVRATRHAEALALSEARHQRGDGEAAALGPGWTPMPAALFVLDQVFHALAIVLAWAVFLASATPIEPFTEATARLTAGRDPAAVHAITLVGVVAVSLVIVNVRAGAFFVATLVRPRETVEGLEVPDDPAAPPRGRGWRLRIGPLEAVAEPDAGGRLAAQAPAPATSAPARIGATIGILERLLIVVFVLTGSQAAVGFVIAAKTLARFRLLDDRNFAEYYLLGTLASVAVAVASGLVASAALATIP